MRLLAGAPSLLGASFDGTGTNFALFSAHAQKIELCLFDPDGREQERIILPERSGDIWHGYLNDVRPGQLYGYRVHGPHDPEHGFRFNANKLLLDPYAKAISGPLILNELHFGHRYGDPRGDLSFDTRNNADVMVRAVVTSPTPVQSAVRPNVPWADTILYEAHVKGLTKLREGVPADWRGTFRGLASPAIVAHLKRLGVTTIELLPVQAFIDDWFVRERGLHNYWGYNTLGFFMPDMRYLGGEGPEIFRVVVDRLHDAGIEVILDVVYNHSCEGDHLGPTLSFRGIDNLSYYRLRKDQPRYYENDTGTGNTLNFAHPVVRQLALDSLRFWAEQFHVDGFRFDLAVTLGRGDGGFETQAPFLAAIDTDPILSRLKLIAEPWDVGEGGYRAGGFPCLWSEWNDSFRKGTRQFWLGPGSPGEFARRMTGSADRFQHNDRSQRASINYVTAHDGFTLADLVQYQAKHNETNLEGNRDGESHNDSSNCGVEGPAIDPKVNSARLQLRKNLLASLMLAHGVPMLLAGDEAGNSQGGNNNAYCQDNETGWIDWSGLGHAGDLTGFISHLADLRRRFPQLRARQWLKGRHADGRYDVRWLTSQATDMNISDWDAPGAKFLAYLLSPVLGDDRAFTIVCNAGAQAVEFTLPPVRSEAGLWVQCLDTSADPAATPGAILEAPALSMLAFFSAP